MARQVILSSHKMAPAAGFCEAAGAPGAGIHMATKLARANLARMPGD